MCRKQASWTLECKNLSANGINLMLLGQTILGEQRESGYDVKQLKPKLCS